MKESDGSDGETFEIGDNRVESKQKMFHIPMKLGKVIEVEHF